LSLFLPACASKKEEKAAEAEPLVNVEAAPVLTTSIQLKIAGEGVLYPVQQQTVVPKITAPVRVFHVNKGSIVHAGQLLAELESQDLAGAVAENQAVLNQAEATYQTTARASVPQETTKAELDVRAAQAVVDAQQKRYDNLQNLLREGAIAQKEVNDSQVSLTQARNQLELAQRVLQDLQSVGREQTLKGAAAQRDAARVRLETSQVQLGYSKIVSQIDGVVTDRPLFAGETAASGSPLLTIMDLSSVIARTHVSQEDAAQIRVGQSANLYPPEGGAAVHGKVTQISPAIDPSNTTVEVWVEAANPGMKLRAGTSLRLEIIARSEPAALVIPLTAVLTSNSGATSVMVVGEGDRPQKKSVKLGIKSGDKVQVLEGVAAGDRVVTTGSYDLSKLDPEVLQKTKLQVEVPKETGDDEEEEN
jgi:multidrug efflux pump subunit AcrA (membrane-fusion protein)